METPKAYDQVKHGIRGAASQRRCRRAECDGASKRKMADVEIVRKRRKWFSLSSSLRRQRRCRFGSFISVLLLVFFCCCRCRFPLSSAPVGFFFSCARSVIATLLAPLLIIRSLNRNVQVEQSDTARDGTRKPRPCVRGNWMENSFNSPPSRRRHRPRDMWHFFPQIFRGKPPKTTKLSERSLFKRVKRLLVWKTRSACSRVGFE